MFENTPAPFRCFLMHLVNHDVDRTVSEVASLEENKKCFECGGQSLWASVSLGSYCPALLFIRVLEKLVLILDINLINY